ncbi:SDR family oxidoreductase [Amycolatopsis thermophila]|uniref:NAD(P)-dependent dehydrogenase (Short-subunit alcohol dehydrogenase family) n=1 Tax=Amycolatopsis thermophila TaxID=206084 RepID=A0ABU0F0Y1_9PSEU|nr:SDR family oxidoreductase [Amycolatopsis thermophila]MDQ0381226.1 NAD(P)-dependent dehydrogenase (short-subunit alcohol dehydrogenase family) [Amycolatopsis thermophila]
MSSRTEHPVAVVTGASGGVGRATAREFAARGYRVALLARGEDGLAAAAEEVRRAGAEALPLKVDVADPDAVERAAEETETALGPIAVWVNDAFTSVFAPFTEIEPAEFRRVTEVTYLGYVHGTQAALRRMRPRNRGAIVQVGSALAYRGIPLQSAYCGAKHAIQGFTESLRCELLHERSEVRVTMVQLPAVNTPQFGWVLSRLRRHAQPVPPIYQPEIAARAIVHAAEHPRRREYWVGGSTVATLVGNAVAPGLLDRYLARTGFGAQQTDRPRDPDRPVNLWSPADQRPGSDAGAHGEFDRQAHHRALQPWASRHRGSLAAAGGIALAAVGWALRR